MRKLLVVSVLAVVVPLGLFEWFSWNGFPKNWGDAQKISFTLLHALFVFVGIAGIAWWHDTTTKGGGR